MLPHTPSTPHTPQQDDSCLAPCYAVSNAAEQGASNGHSAPNTWNSATDLPVPPLQWRPRFEAVATVHLRRAYSPASAGAAADTWSFGPFLSYWSRVPAG